MAQRDPKFGGRDIVEDRWEGQRRRVEVMMQETVVGQFSKKASWRQLWEYLRKFIWMETDMNQRQRLRYRNENRAEETIWRLVAQELAQRGIGSSGRTFCQ